MATVILENVNVDFPIYGAQQRSLRKAIFERATGGRIQREGRNNERVIVKALTDISLTLRDGDRLGLVGHNGSGKSTLLKLLAGIYEPVSGHLRVEGRVTPLFDTMPGLDMEDTGYENIITSGMLIGLTREEIEAKIPEIEEFCELGEYLALPVRTYSLGMTMRLGFALVTALDPGVLLMDEGFGTGDLRFTERAQARMADFIGRSRIMVLASHSDATIRSMCNKAIMMESGRLVAFGPVDEICDQYERSVRVANLRAARLAGSSVPEELDVPLVAEEEEEIEAPPIYSEASIESVGLRDRLRRSNGAARFTRVAASDEDGNQRWDYSLGETAIFRFEFRVLERVADLVFLFRLSLTPTKDQTQEIVFADMREVLSLEPVEAGYEGVVELSLQISDLLPNKYLPQAWLGRANNLGGYDIVDANVGLPVLVIRELKQPEMRYGLVSLKYETRTIAMRKPAPIDAI